VSNWRTPIPAYWLGLLLAGSSCGHRAAGGVTADAAGEGDAAQGRDAGPDATEGADVLLAPDVPQRVPREHRPTAVACPRERGTQMGAGPMCEGFFCQCTTDADCRSGLNGRCVLELATSGATRLCSYDGCFDDADCPDRQVCACRASGASADANRCVVDGGCRVDADCGPGGACSPSYGQLCSFGYFCHTPNDACVNDADCTASTCAFDPAQKRWRCQIDLCPDAA
jgi:hypothetical protein